MAQITDKSRVSIGLVVSMVGLAFWVGTIASTQSRHSDDIAELKRDRDEDRKTLAAELRSVAAEMRSVANSVSTMGGQVELLLMLEPRDQGRARKP